MSIFTEGKRVSFHTNIMETELVKHLMPHFPGMTQYQIVKLALNLGFMNLINQYGSGVSHPVTDLEQEQARSAK
jgi:hypothetical protein